MIFTIRIQRFALLLRKNRSTDLHRFLPYGIFFFRHEDKRTWFFLTKIIISHGMHGILFISHRWHRCFRYAQDFVLLRYKTTYNKIRSLTASNTLYGFAQIFALRYLFFRHEDKRTWFSLTEIIISHKFHELSQIIIFLYPIYFFMFSWC